MIDSALVWAMAHPMNALGVMVGFALLMGMAGMSREMCQHIGRRNHPPC